MEVRPGPYERNNEVARQQAEMRMVRWMCGVKLPVQDNFEVKG